MDNSVKLVILGRVNIATQLDEGHRIAIRKHNEEVDKNSYILSKVIDCVKFCGAFELALRGHNETDSSDNPSIFRGLVNFVASLDNVLEEQLRQQPFLGHIKDSTKQAVGLHAISGKGYILEEVTATDFIAFKLDETTDVSTRCQLVLVLLYIDSHGNIQERFF